MPEWAMASRKKKGSFCFHASDKSFSEVPPQPSKRGYFRSLGGSAPKKEGSSALGGPFTKHKPFNCMTSVSRVLASVFFPIRLLW